MLTQLHCDSLVQPEISGDQLIFDELVKVEIQSSTNEQMPERLGNLVENPTSATITAAQDLIPFFGK